jgi:MFS family permease
MKNLNEKLLFWASFLTLIAAGMGFSIRGDILADWGRQFGFTQTELGEITGMGLVGFGITIIAFGFVADLVGYGRLMIIAFLLHVASVVVTLAAPYAFETHGKAGAYWCLYIGQLCLSLANGTCEAVINPLTATLFPTNKTHWLNILHAGWPGGLVLGALVSLALGNTGWEVRWGIILAPMLMYGLMMIGRPFPRSEAHASGVPFGQMIATVLAPILLFLFLMHALVGYVELGTDSWIINITYTVLADKNVALLAFIWTNILMFSLRFFAGPIVHKISPLGLLFASAVIGTIGLVMLGSPMSQGTWPWLAAVTVYGLGKTFYWPTLLGVISERYPQGGAIALGLSGGIGMISAGLLGGPLIGYKQDYVATHYLQESAPATYERYKSAEAKAPLPVLPEIAGLDNAKVGDLLGEPGKDNGRGQLLEADLAALQKSGRSLEQDEKLKKRVDWWNEAKKYASEDEKSVGIARLRGGQKALYWTAAVPAALAVGFLILIIVFRLRGGYQAEVLTGHAARDAEYTGGVEGPVR